MSVAWLFCLMGKYEDSFIWNWDTTERNREDITSTAENYKPQSSKITCLTKLGHISFQIRETPEELAALAKSWAALLPLLFKCWKEHQVKEEEISLMFWTMCPWSLPVSQPEILWITESASDSTRTWEIPKTEANSTPSCSAKVSVVSAEKGACRTLLDAAMREPIQSRITTPIQEVYRHQKQHRQH